MDALVRQRSLERKGVQLNEEGARLRREIEVSLLKIPNHIRLDLGLRHHDTAELVVGDPPFPVKAEDEGLKAGYDRLEPLALDRMGVDQLPKIAGIERAKIKICDLLEMMTHGMTEREMGNLLAAPIVIRTERAALARMEQEPDITAGEAQRVRAWIDAQWERHERVLRMADVNHTYSRSTRSRL